MKEFVEKLIEKFEKEAFAVQSNQGIKHPSTHDMFLETFTVRQIEEIINQLAEEYKDKYVSRAVFEQVVWENNVAISQLEELGYGLGEKISKSNNNGWIHCSERLPEYTGEYNVTVVVASELGSFEDVTTLRFENIKGKEPTWVIPKDEIYRVIAWMELPKKYQKGE